MATSLVTAAAVRTGARVLGDALLIDRGTIVDVGRADRLRRPGIDVVDLGAATIVPGLRDAHLHPVGYAASLSGPTLDAATDFGGVTELLRAAAAALPEGTALAAMRLDDEQLTEGRLPDRRVLDAAVSDRPVVVFRYCGHVAVANTQALELAGIGPGTPDPDGGLIDRDELGRPTGVVRETAAELVAAALRGLAAPVTTERLVEAVAGLAGIGITGIGAIVTTDQGCWAGAGSELDALIDAAPTLPIDVAALVVAKTPAELEAAAQRLGDAGGRVSFLGLKVFGDGSLGGRTAAMYEPYTDDPGQRGTLRIADWVAPTARAAVALGGRVAIHAIGDRANGRVLDLMEGLIAAGADPDLLRIEHASVLAATDLRRWGATGVTAVVQPAFLASETGWLGARLGPERLRRTYPFRSLLDAGVPLAGSSDCPVEPPHPLWGMATAVDRSGIVPEEALTPAEALDLFTLGAARAIGQNGALERGRPATFTALTRDPTTGVAATIRATDIVGTWVDGTRIPLRPDHVAWTG